MAGKITQQLPPGLSTRAGNKTTHPGAAAGLALKLHGSREETQKKHELAEQQKRRRKQRLVCDCRQLRSRIGFVVRILNYAGLTHQRGSQASVIVDGLDRSDNSGQEYLPPPAPSKDEESDKESDEPKSEEVVQVQDQGSKGGQKRKPRHDDISALRTTDVASATNTGGNTLPAKSDHPSLSKKKKSSKKKPTFDSQWLEASKAQNTKAVAAAAEATQDDDSLVTMGGFVQDDEDDGVERKAVKAAGKEAVKKVPRVHLYFLTTTSLTLSQAMAKIVPNKQVITQTELRGGTKKWMLNHLPPEMSVAFMDQVIPLAKEKVGTLVPWANLMSAEIQVIIDTIYGPGKYIVEGGDVWHGLISYHLQSWHNSFSMAACNALEDYFNDPDNADVLGMPKAWLNAVNWWLDWQGKEGEEMVPYQFNECHDGATGQQKQGFCESTFIVHTFATAHIDYICPPNPENPKEDMPIGALILSLQAVEHALKQCATDGTCQIDTSRKGDFSFDNYGDTNVHHQDRRGKVVDKFEPRASRYIVSVKNLDHIKHWKPILEEASRIVLGITKGCRGPKSRSSSCAGTELELKPEIKEFMVVSDSSFLDSDSDVPGDEVSDGAHKLAGVEVTAAEHGGLSDGGAAVMVHEDAQMN
ncbi:hypothetical protein DXG01_016994 [Tephrocybe rancida]|nr:hypothetical protein DXG01_016994 [Tephrocybe rancida]